LGLSSLTELLTEVNSFRQIQESRSPCLAPEDENIRFWKRYVFQNTRRWKKFKKSITHIAIHHHQNQLESTLTSFITFVGWSGRAEIQLQRRVLKALSQVCLKERVQTAITSVRCKSCGWGLYWSFAKPHEFTF
jgi:hypothetical protein